MAELVRLARDGLLDEVVLALVVEDDVNLRMAAGGVGSTKMKERLLHINFVEVVQWVVQACSPSRTFLLEEPQMSGPNMML